LKLITAGGRDADHHGPEKQADSSMLANTLYVGHSVAPVM
jgi:hypothetical protein